MMRSVLLLLLAGLGVAAFGIPTSELKLPVRIRELKPPAADYAGGYAVGSKGDGILHLAWLEAASGGIPSLRFSSYDAKTGAWAPAVTPVESLSLKKDGLDAGLTLSLSEGRIDLGWRSISQPGGSSSCRLRVSSTDGGKTWGGPEELGGEQDRETVSFPDGTRLVVYRDAAPGEPRDPRALRFWEGKWQEVQRVGREGWMSEQPVDSPVRISVQAPRVAAAWYTAADDEPRILVCSSPDAGLRWTGAARADLGHARGAPDIVLLRDGSHWVSWLENRGDDESQPAGLFLRRTSPGAGTVAPALLWRESLNTVLSQPRLVLLREGNTGGSIELIQAFVEKRERPLLRLLVVGTPTAEELAEIDRNCNCGSGSLPGSGIRGTILSFDFSKATLRIAHEPVPGLLKRGELEVKASLAVFGSLREGRGFIGRIERRGDDWHLFDLRVFVQPPPGGNSNSKAR